LGCLERNQAAQLINISTAESKAQTDATSHVPIKDIAGMLVIRNMLSCNLLKTLEGEL
jgi:hypothetical protein